MKKSLNNLLLNPLNFTCASLKTYHGHDMDLFNKWSGMQLMDRKFSVEPLKIDRLLEQKQTKCSDISWLQALVKQLCCCDETFLICSCHGVLTL